MRVVLLGPYPPPHGGVQTNLVAIRDYLRSHGHWAAAVNLTRHRRAAADNVYYPRGAVETAGLLVRLPADILHLHIGGNLRPRLLALALLCSRLPGRKTVLTFHSGGYPSSPAGRAAGRRGFAAFVLRRLDALIAVNPEIAAFFRRCGVPANRIHLIAPHSQPADSAPLPGPLRAFFAAHDPVLLSVAGLEPEYCLPLQIQALGPIRAVHPNAGLAILGAGSQEAELRRLAASEPYRDHIFLAGDVPHAAALEAIRQCRLMLRTTLYDGDSVAVREALELGAPVVATDNGMRPPGCRLIGEPSLEPLIRSALEALDAPRPAPAPSSGARNLEAVLRLYQTLIAPRQ